MTPVEVAVLISNDLRFQQSKIKIRVTINGSISLSFQGFAGRILWGETE